MMGVCWRAFKGLRWMLVAPRARPPLRIEAVEYSFSRPDATRHWSMALENTGFKSRTMCVLCTSLRAACFLLLRLWWDS